MTGAASTLTNNLETKGVQLLAKENPILLALICRDNFLPPTQLIMCLNLLESYPEKTKLRMLLTPLLQHHSSIVRKTTSRILGLEDTASTS